MSTTGYVSITTILAASALLVGCLDQKEQTVSADAMNSPLPPGYVLDCRISKDQNGKQIANECTPYQVSSTRGPGAIGLRDLSEGNNPSMRLEGALFAPIGNGTNDMMAVETPVTTNQGVIFVMNLGLMDGDSLVLLQFDGCWTIKEKLPTVANMIERGELDRDCKGSSVRARWNLYRELAKYSAADLMKISTVHRITPVSQAVAMQRRDFILSERAARTAEAERTLDVVRTSGREYAKAFPGLAQVQSHGYIHYGVPMIGTLYTIDVASSDVKCSAVKDFKTTCSWRQLTRVSAANPVWAALQFDAPLPVTENMRQTFVFADGTWQSPSLRQHYASRDRSSRSAGTSNGPDAFERSQEITRQTACSAAAGSSSTMASVTQSLYGC